MGLTSAMFTGLSGLNSNQFKIDTIGDNLANVNTTAFKESRASFENQFALTLSGGTAPGNGYGGTNPSQIGRGSLLSGVQRLFTPGAIETTGVPTDMAIEGEGFFVISAANAQQAFTRDGTFKVDAQNQLVTADGFFVQGYGVDSDFNLVPGVLTNLTIPLGTLSTARATSRAFFDGNLNANGTVATQGTILNSQQLLSAPGVPATDTTLLTSLRDAANPGALLFADGDVITVSGARRGGREVADASFTVSATSTLGDFAQFLNNTMGINSDPALTGQPGIRVSDGSTAPAGTLIVEGNVGTENALEIPLSSIRSTNPAFTNPFNFTQTQEANGESLFTTFQAFDSLGTPVQVNLTMTLESKSNSGNTWRFYMESPDDTDASQVLGPTGTVTFDNDGRMISLTGNTIQVTRDSTGAVTPLQIELNFDDVTGLTTDNSSLVMTTQDGFATGTLNNFSVGTDGVITGTFSNGLTRTLGQLALATFINPGGLIGSSNNLFLVGPNSGQPIIAPAGTGGSGKVIGGGLELSNVDMTREFIGLITASTGFSANGRVISTSNDLLNELLMIAR